MDLTCSPLINTPRCQQCLHQQRDDIPVKKRFSDETIIRILSEAGAGISARELFRKYAISDATFYT